MLQPITSPLNAVTFRVRFGNRLPRHMPRCLQDSWTCSEWQDFCDAYDSIVVQQYQEVRVSYGLLVAGLLLGFLLILLASRLAGIFMGCTIIFFSALVTLLYMSWMQHLTISRLEKLCKDCSVKHGKLFRFQIDQDFTRIIDPASTGRQGRVLSFTIREYYLKICHERGNDGEIPSVPTATSCDSNLSGSRSIFREVEVVTNKQRDVEERLQALDQLRDVLSTDEYDEKRQEIVVSV